MLLSKPNIRRRIERELHDYDYTMNDNDVEFIRNNKTIKVNFKKYPFVPPKVFINNQELIYCPSRYPTRIWQKYIDMYPHRCPCCTSLLCFENWSPILSFMDILKEYDTIMEKFKIIHKIFIIQKMNLPEDIIHVITSYVLGMDSRCMWKNNQK
jgi:hypothetical protein